MNQIVKAKKKLNLKKTPNQEAYKCIIIKFFHLKKNIFDNSTSKRPENIKKFNFKQKKFKI
jgi:hypothetical protein